jgi:putative phosphonate transport system ATP-binding protein
MMQRDADRPLLVAEGLSKWYGKQLGCRDVSFALYPGEVIAVVGESGSGKTTLLQLLSSQLESSSGRVLYRMRDGVTRDLAALGEAERRFLLRTDWGYVHQDPTCGLRMTVSAGANVGERLMALGWRHYGQLRSTAGDWLGRVEIDDARIDDTPSTYSGGMRQRLQIARNLVTQPRLVFMDEPTGGLDVSVQARLLDLLRGLVAELSLAAVIVTHDLAVARLLSHRTMVMKNGVVCSCHRSSRREAADVDRHLVRDRTGLRLDRQVEQHLLDRAVPSGYGDPIAMILPGAVQGVVRFAKFLDVGRYRSTKRRGELFKKFRIQRSRFEVVNEETSRHS